VQTLANPYNVVGNSKYFHVISAKKNAEEIFDAFEFYVLKKKPDFSRQI